MIKQIKLYNVDYGFSDRKRGGVRTWYLCAMEVRKYFNVPGDVKQVYFTVYHSPSSGRVKLTFDGGILVDGRQHPYWEETTKKAILRLLKKHGTFYVGCEYV